MVTQRYKRPDDCKMRTEAAIKKLGYVVNPTNVNQQSNKECVVTYSNISMEVLTQESYNFDVELSITLTVDNNNEVPYVIFELVEKITKEVEASETRHCTGFYFRNCHTNFLGDMCEITLVACYQFELDWLNPDYLDE